MDEITLRLEERRTVTLKSLGTAGYQWSAAVDNPRIVRMDRVRVASALGATPPGRSLDEQFVMTGLLCGETIVRFTQARSFEPAKPPLSTYEIAVRVSAD